ncbi:hypothetical protein GGQ80_002977 [Sphingomonas jinjuensis]|uniref:Uncharacterized protein n=1 Tax=Sphingomonas jinjuensis TaxID=535907 RepID=A0A840FAK4_9SPHN|nr:hypothetical protein [Sphingomonas jinjuensis]MBB4155060.1 hypothetical protein [Sphingomonas jinjuensis]
MLALLSVLDGGFGPSSNDEVLAVYLSAVGLACSRRDLQERLEELARAGLVSLSRREALCVVELSRDGSDVAQGLVEHEGVARGSTDCPYR